jgi:hypothetical protein
MATTKHSKIIIIVCAIFLFCGAGYYFDKIYTGLASDEEMIAYFKEHKAEFEELIQRYRNFNTTIEYIDTEVHIGNGKTEMQLVKRYSDNWDNNSNSKELLNKLNVYQIKPINDGSADFDKSIWLPNPYSIETAKQRNSLTEDEKIQLLNKYGMIRIELMPRNKYWHSSLHYQAIRKDFYHIPEIPRIENGKLLGTFNVSGDYSFRRTILTSLNYIVPEWDGCVLRQIEPQWFLRACSVGRKEMKFISW